MSVAYYIVLNNPSIDFDNIVNGKAIAAETDNINAFCEKHGLKPIAYYHSQDVNDLIEQDDIDLSDQPINWFNAREGVEWVNSLITKIISEEHTLNTDAIIDDLLEYKDILEKAHDVGAKWHIEMDF